MTYKAAVFLALVGCGVPFVLSQVSGALEPYPALLLPAGATTINIQGPNVQTSRYELVSVGADGREHELSPEAFFAPLPAQYWARLARLGYGLKAERSRKTRIALGRWSLTFDQARDATQASRAEVERWFRQRLSAVGREGDPILRTRLVRIAIDIAEGREVNRQVEWTHDVAL